MKSNRNMRRAIGTGILGLALVAAVSLLPQQEVEAVGCEDGGLSGTRHEWVMTSEAQARTATGECGADAVCLEWCFISCGNEEPQGVFDCFPAS